MTGGRPGPEASGSGLSAGGDRSGLSAGGDRSGSELGCSGLSTGGRAEWLWPDWLWPGPTPGLGPVDPDWRPDFAALTRRLAEQLAEEGHADPGAAEVLVDRGRVGLSQAAYARLLGVTVEDVVAVEEGRPMGRG
jgi:hypothetical protein